MPWRPSDEQTFQVIDKKIGDLAGEVREFNCDALILDMDASSVADFEQLQKIDRMVGAQMWHYCHFEQFQPLPQRVS